jgi:glycerol-3-phosphate dehydrogenase
MRVAVIGGGINGVMSAWELAKAGHQVTLFERDLVMGATSSASTKLLHGGLRYLEHGSLLLVREALRERSWWFSQAPHLCHPLRILLPHYQGQGRPRWMLGIGLWLYRFLAGGANIAPHQWLSREQALEASPDLKPDGLLGAYAFWDGQMDDHKLGLWAADQARAAGVTIQEHTPVRTISTDGDLETDTGRQHFEAVTCWWIAFAPLRSWRRYAIASASPSSFRISAIPWWAPPRSARGWTNRSPAPPGSASTSSASTTAS